MNLFFCRILQAASVALVTLVLSGCGASSTIDPFVPTRVIGLGDAYNDTNAAAATVQGTGTVQTVVQEVGRLFNVSTSNITSYAASGASISNLTTQIQGVGSFQATDLVVISAGSKEIREGYVAATFDPVASDAVAEAAAVELANQIKEVVRLGGRHVLVLQPLEFSLTPLAYSNRTKYPKQLTDSPTVKFNAKIASELQTYFETLGYNQNPVIYGALGLSSTFNTYISQAYEGSNNIFANLKDPKCGSASSLVGCPGASDSNYLFADGVNLTPAGNRWVAAYLFNSTRQGWR